MYFSVNYKYMLLLEFLCVGGFGVSNLGCHHSSPSPLVLISSSHAVLTVKGQSAANLDSQNRMTHNALSRGEGEMQQQEEICPGWWNLWSVLGVVYPAQCKEL